MENMPPSRPRGCCLEPRCFWKSVFSRSLPMAAYSFFRLAAESPWLFASCRFTDLGPILTVAPRGGLCSESWLHWHPGGTGSGREGARAGRGGREGQCIRGHGLDHQLLLRTRTAAEHRRCGALATSPRKATPS